MSISSAAASAAQTAANAAAKAADSEALALITTFKDSTIEWLAGHWMSIPIALIIFLLGKWLAGMFSRMLARLLKRQKFDELLVGFLSRALYFALLLAVIIAAVSQLGVNVASLVAVFGTVALAVGLALKDSLSSFASGVMLAMFRPFTVGDYVEAGGTAGTVEQVNIFYTELKTPDNKQVYVPNANIMNSVITNVTAKPTRRVDLVMGIGYEDDIDRARTVMMDIIQKDERILKTPEPVVAVNELADSSVNFVVRPWVHRSDYWDVYWGLTEQFKKAFDEAGISIPYPQQDVHLHTVEKETNS